MRAAANAVCIRVMRKFADIISYYAVHVISYII
jgi:hypothetical protein